MSLLSRRASRGRGLSTILPIGSEAVRVVISLVGGRQNSLGTVGQRLIGRYERVLRIGDHLSPWDRMRARSVYMIAWVFAALQVANILGMTYSYGHWTTDHTAAVFAIVTFLLIPLFLRWSKRFPYFAAAFALFSFSALIASTRMTGIHSSLIPLVVVGPMMSAFIGGWRSAVVFSVLSAGWLIYVYAHSFVFPPEATAPITIVNEQRLLQALYALTLAAFVSSVVSSALENAVTAMDQAVKDASRSLRVKEDFLATMSHELRTPLNGVIGLTEALLARGPGPLNGEQGDMLGHVRGSGEHLLALLNDILDLSKIEAGKIRIDPRPYAVEELVEGTRDTYREAAHAKGIDLQIHINADVPPTVLIDDLRLRQVLNNLVSNGIKFTDTGSVTLTAERAADGKLLFRVIDTGQGIPEDRQKGIFDPFDQGEHNTVRNFGGTGLGLPISQQLCELMDGSLKLESSAPGQTIFCVSLPCHPAELEENGPQRRGLISGGLEGLRVLVAEDNPVNRLVMRNFLKAWGAQAVFAEDGIEALEMFTSADFDIVLVDRQMPRLDGDGVVKAIRRGTEHPDVPIIAVTADAMASDREHMLGIGVDEYISKPLKPQSLKSAICRLIASPPDDPNEGVGDAAGGSFDSAAIEG